MTPQSAGLDRADARTVGGDDLPFLLGVGIIDTLLEQEAVELRFGQRIDALLLDRVLRRDDHEAVAQRHGSRHRW